VKYITFCDRKEKFFLSGRKILWGLALSAANFVIFVVESPQRMLDTLPAFSSSLPHYPSKIASARKEYSRDSRFAMPYCTRPCRRVMHRNGSPCAKMRGKSLRPEIHFYLEK
jgi:hypothetical protein